MEITVKTTEGNSFVISQETIDLTFELKTTFEFSEQLQIIQKKKMTIGKLMLFHIFNKLRDSLR